MKFLDNHGEKILYITWGILFFICLIAGCDVRAHAASGESQTKLPYFVDSNNYTNLDGYTISDLSSYAQTRWGGAGMYDFDFFVPGVLAYDWTENINGVDYNFTRVYVPVPNGNSSYNFSNITYSNYSEFDYSLNSIQMVFTNYYSFVFSSYRNQYNDCSFYSNTFYVNFLNGSYTPSYISEYFYVIKDGDPVSNMPVFVNTSGEVVVGHSVQPNLDGDNVDPNDLPDISSHQPSIPSPPTVDTSSPSTLLNSIFELLEWGFNALISSINGFMSYIGDLFSYLIQLLINNIKNAIDNIYQNFANLFEPILNALSSLTQNISDKVDYITAPIDPSTISSGIETTDLVNDVTGYKTALTTFVGSFNNVSEPSTYKIPIHFENISMFSDVGVQYIDLGWLNSVKTLIRAFVACLVTYGVIISIFDSVPNYINGGGGEDD